MNSSTLAYQDEGEDLLAPENFSMVEKGVYRSAFPRSKNIPFLRSLRLRAVVALIPEDYPAHMTDFYEQYGVKLISHGLDGNKWPFKEINEIGETQNGLSCWMPEEDQRLVPFKHRPGVHDIRSTQDSAGRSAVYRGIRCAGI